MLISRNLCYSDVDGRGLELDHFVANESEHETLVLLIHGGGWISGDRGMYEDEAQFLALQGVDCATVSYRLAPLFQFPDCVEDIREAILFAKRELGYKQVLVLGNSAGGHLAAMSALEIKTMPEGSQADGAICICPITDMTDPRESHFPISWSFVEQFLGSLDDEELCKQASPITYVNGRASNMVLIHGEDDDIVPVGQSEKFFEALNSAGIEAELHLMPGEMHSFTFGGWMQIRRIYLEAIRTMTAFPAGAN